MSRLRLATLTFGALLVFLLVLFAGMPLTAGFDITSIGTPTPVGRAYVPFVAKQFSPEAVPTATPTATPTPTTAPSALPAAPTGLGAVNLAQRTIRLFWTDNSDNESGFRVEQYAAGQFTLLTTVSANVVSADIGGLAPSTAYTFRVYAYNAAGSSGNSNQIGITTMVEPPASPGNLTADALSSSRIQLNWIDNSDNEMQFRIEQMSNALPFFTSVMVVPTNTTSTIVTGLAATTVYTYRVRAENPGGNSGYSNSAGATTMWPSFLFPYSPSSLTGTVLSTSSVRLEWIDNSTNETSFRVERSDGGGGYTLVQTTSADVTNTVVSGLSPATQYTYAVRAHRSSNNSFSGYSNPVTVTTLANVAPAAPSNLSAAAASTTTVILSWQDNSDNETGFSVEQRTGLGAFSPVLSPPANATSATRSGLLPATQYTFRARASNSYGNSAYSNLFTVTTPSNTAPTVSLPAAPTNLVAIPLSSSGIDLYWTNNADNDAGIKMQHSTDGVDFTDYYTGTKPGTNHAEDRGLAAVSTHYYRVQTYNAAGRSAFSNVAWATTFGSSAPAAPTNLQAVAQSSSIIRLTYDHAMANVEGFMLSISQNNVDWVTDWATVTVKTVDVTNLEPGRQYWFKVRAYNRASSNSLNVSALTSAASATTQSSGNAARFVNNSSYPIISLTVNGVEKFPAAPQGIPVGGYFELPLTVGSSYNIAWANGFWDGASRFPMYQGSGSYVQPSGQGTYTIENPRLGQLLTHFRPVGSWGYWLGEVWIGTQLNSYGFCFTNNATDPAGWRFYVNGVLNSSGYASIPSGGYPKPGTFNVTFSVAPGADYQGTLDETSGLSSFYMHNGPADWRWVEYNYAGATCP